MVFAISNNRSLLFSIPSALNNSIMHKETLKTPNTHTHSTTKIIKQNHTFGPQIIFFYIFIFKSMPFGQQLLQVPKNILHRSCARFLLATRTINSLNVYNAQFMNSFFIPFPKFQLFKPQKKSKTTFMYRYLLSKIFNR